MTYTCTCCVRVFTYHTGQGKAQSMINSATEFKGCHSRANGEDGLLLCVACMHDIVEIRLTE